MGIREHVNKSPIVSSIVIVVLVAVCAFAAVRFMRTPDSGLGSAYSFYTVDDGKTWFKDSSDKLPPFTTKDGKTAYRCYVFTFDGGKTQFVSHLERYTPQGKRQAEARSQAGNTGPTVRRLSVGEMEIKRPGDAEWIAYGDARTADIVRPKRPDGSTEGIEPVWP